MKTIISELERYCTDLTRKHDALTREIGHCPPGELQCHFNHGRYQYLQVTYESGTRHRHGINRCEELLHGLARKQYLRKHIEVLETNKTILSDATSRLVDMTPDMIIESVVTGKHSLPREYYTRPIISPLVGNRNHELTSRLEEYRKWANAAYEKSSYKPGNLKITTLNGLKVRSKSEGMIATTLDERGIPYRYEQVIHLESGTIAPDFTFMTSDGSELYWEHAGMINSPSYSFRHHLKMMQYEAAGILPWRDLIITYDIDNEINMKMVDAMIKNILMPLL